jgi:thiosulfate/3-mercaptopyruvate sulfurtransferase
MAELSSENIPLLVNTKWLAEHLNDSNIRIVDIRGHVIPASEPPPHYFNHHADYLKSHIPNTVFIDWVEEITQPGDPTTALIAPPDRFAAVMQRCAIGPDTHVVAYDDANGMFAARLWWDLQYYGHSKVSVLDGGWQKWLAEGRPVDDTIPATENTAAPFVATPNREWRRMGDEVLAKLNTNTCLLDVRTTDEFTGKSSRVKRKGHIPGAVNLPRSRLLAPDGTMLPPDKLREQFAAQGIDESTPEVIVYCNSGVSSSYGLLALRVAGLTRSAIYDGSWKNWANDETKPIVEPQI